jgi:hypothetical protein|tara:strand:- start:2082 stop:2441 length:360 start_codon:yes stop_codon:yes gene_type:complete
MPTIGVLATEYRMTSGKKSVSTFAAPILYAAPAYHSSFCSKCGSPVPPANPDSDKLEIPAGLLDEDPGVAPDKHIFTEFIPPWDRIADTLPQFNIRELFREREGIELPDDFELRSHYDI